MSTPDLRGGVHKIDPLNSEELRLLGDDLEDQGVAAYIVSVELIGEKRTEVVALFEYAETFDDDSIARLMRLAETLRCTSVVCVVPLNNDVDFSTRVRTLPIHILEPVAFALRLLSVSDLFENQLRDVATIDRVDHYGTEYQKRSAKSYGMTGRAQSGQVVDIDALFTDWLGAHSRSSPILLLGERGTGKTWQMLQFALTAARLHKQQPWRYGPAFFVRLSDLVNHAAEAGAATPVICNYIVENYSGLRSTFGPVPTLGTLLGLGHAVLCIDGLDEMDHAPTDSQVRARVAGLLSLLSKRTRFVLSCRTGHFTSLSGLMDMQAWSGTVRDTFSIVELQPFDHERQLSYIHAATSTETSDRLETLLGLAEQTQDPLRRALAICGRHPGLLAHLKDRVSSGDRADPLDLVRSAIVDNLIDFNINKGRSSRYYQTPSGNVVDLSLERRKMLLEDLAWYMAERRLPTLDLSRLPARLRITYEINDDALQRELRSQTVLEIVEREPLSFSAQNDSTLRAAGDDGISESASTWSVADGLDPSRNRARFTLVDETADATMGGETSVAAALFLAQYLRRALTQTGPFGPLPDEHRLGVLGRVQLGAMAGALLREMLRETGLAPRTLGRQAWSLFRGFAGEPSAERKQRAFTTRYRYLASNLVQIGGLTKQEADLCDPWTTDVKLILTPPQRLSRYEVVLVPSDASSGVGRPFLLGTHEITNDEYYAFVTSNPPSQQDDTTIIGRHWSREHMTLASSRSNELSPNHRLSNEYHLFHWRRSREVDHSPSASAEGADDAISRSEMHAPPRELLRHPVSWVSWYTAAAFCDWLSLGEQNFTREYQGVLRSIVDGGDSHSPGPIESIKVGYRMPTRSEWIWAARAGYHDIRRPWEMFPYYVSLQQREKGRARAASNPEAWHRYVSEQQVMRRVLLDSSERQTNEVLYDELNDFGMSGLVGNVREWCHERAESDREATDMRWILGATANLGEDTFDFDFDYATPLYARNTNPDVGFRVARSLTEYELKILERRQLALVQLPETPVG